MNILVIAQHIFPMNTPRSHRTTELIKELSRQGHQVTVYAVLGKHDYTSFEKEFNIAVKNIPVRLQLAPYNSDGAMRRTFVDKVLSKLFGKLFEFPYIEFLSTIPKIIQAEKKFDLLISIADPHHIHWGCAKAKSLYPHQFPAIWVADCGDPFMMNGNTNDHYAYFEKFERTFCAGCNFITVPLENAVEGYYPEYRSKIRVIPQGFNFEMPSEQMIDPENKILTFAFAGNFYSDIRNPEKIMNYLATQKVDFKFYVYTQFPHTVLPYKKLLGERLEVKNTMPRLALIDTLKNMDFLLNLENYKSPTQMPSKLIDYSIANRPILSINPVDVNEGLINEFFEKKYHHRFVLPNLEQYKISQVAAKFVALSSGENM